MLLLLVEEDPVCHEDWYWLSRTFHSRRFFFMSRSLFEKNQKIILIKLGLAWTAVFPPGGLQRPQVHPLWLQGTILFEELWQRNEKSPACSSSFELCTRSAMRLEKKEEEQLLLNTISMQLWENWTERNICHVLTFSTKGCWKWG